MSTSANGAADALALVPPWGTNLIDCLLLSAAVVFAMFISNLSSDKIAHVHIYATTILCVIIWIKSNIKMSNFLTVFINFVGSLF